MTPMLHKFEQTELPGLVPTTDGGETAESLHTDDGEPAQDGDSHE